MRKCNFLSFVWMFVLAFLSIIITGCGKSIVGGGYVLTVQPAQANADPIAVANSSVLGIVKLQLNDNGRYDFGTVWGDWKLSGDTLTLTPTSPATPPPFGLSTMANACSILTKPVQYKVSNNGNKLVSSTSGPDAQPLEFTRSTSDAALANR